MPRRIPLALLLLSLAQVAEAEPRFTPVPIPVHEYVGGWEHFVGGGVAVMDCDGDRLPDAYVAGGADPAVLFRNTTAGVGAKVTFAIQTPEALKLAHVTGAYPLDIDSDGILDLMILRVGENLLLRGGPDCAFTRFPDDLGFTTSGRWSTAFSATWEAGNSLPTLAVGNYVDRSDPEGPFETCDASFLYRPKDGRYPAPLRLEPGYCTLSMLFSDWGRKGRADLRVSNDRHYYVRGGSEQMWAMEAEPRLYTNEDGWKSYSLWGMGIASRDLTGDGNQDIYLTSMGDQKLQMLDPTAEGPSFVDATYARGTTAHRPYFGDDGRPSTGWHVTFGDIENNGLDDIFVAKGNVEQMPGAAMLDPNNLMIQQPDGRFIEQGLEAGIATTDRSRGAGLVDFNLDGLLDLIVVNRRAPVEIYQNTSPGSGNWLQLILVQNGANAAAVGSFVELRAEGRTWSREVTVGGGHASGQAGLIHFGIGSAEAAEIRIHWPDGFLSDWQLIGVNKIYTVTRNDGNFDILKAN